MTLATLAGTTGLSVSCVSSNLFVMSTGVSPNRLCRCKSGEHTLRWCSRRARARARIGHTFAPAKSMREGILWLLAASEVTRMLWMFLLTAVLGLFSCGGLLLSTRR
jgi:hypothetical protein